MTSLGLAGAVSSLVAPLSWGDEPIAVSTTSSAELAIPTLPTANQGGRNLESGISLTTDGTPARPTGSFSAFLNSNQKLTSDGLASSDLRLHAQSLMGQGPAAYDIDIDRALIKLEALSVGRVHPFELGSSSALTQPWSIVSRIETINYGLGLNSKFGEPRTRLGREFELGSEPALNGWIGLHYWSDPNHSDHFALGVSYSPVTLVNRNADPRMASSQATLPNSNHTGALRSSATPLIDTNQQIMGQLEYRTDTNDNQSRSSWRGRAWLSNKETHSPGFDAIQSWQYGLSQVLNLNSDWSIANTSIVDRADFSATEFSLHYRNVRATYSDEFAFDSEPQSSKPFFNHLIGLESEISLNRSFLLFGSIKHHLSDASSYWVESALRYRVHENIDLVTGLDWFTGKSPSGFGALETSDSAWMKVKVGI